MRDGKNSAEEREIPALFSGVRQRRPTGCGEVVTDAAVPLRAIAVGVVLGLQLAALRRSVVWSPGERRREGVDLGI
ncbi:hypothetical protein [Amycolatopsis sp. NPDC000740]|uniref:hypothetical protein n=1 Tax=Amycolatopsis sp. NPDC000740 TaxID=3154269 RepID=UPI0033235CD7